MSDLENFNAVLDTTQEIRKRIVKELSECKTPETKDDRAFLIAMLDGMDRNALSRTRLKQESDSAKVQQRAAAVLSGILTKMNKNDFISQSTGKRDEPDKDFERPVLDMNEGEDFIGVEELSYKGFMEKYDND